MAENIAKSLTKNSNIESAGLRIVEETATKNTLLVLKKKYGIDVSEHIPKKINIERLGDFAKVIALDKEVYEYLKPLVEASILEFWDIEDPFGEDYSKYLEVQMLLDEKINELINC